MKFRLGSGLGDSLDSPTPAQMQSFLEALDTSDSEHGAAWVATDDEHVLEWNGDGRLVWDTPDHRRHLKNVEKPRVVELWQLFVNGDVAALEQLPWEGGNGWVETPEWRLELETQRTNADREFWERMGPEDASLQCRHEGCARGQTLISHFCRVHNFEAMRGKPCPFSD